METSPPLERSTFPSLRRLVFYGASEYVEAFVARTHMPALATLSIKFFNQLIFEIPQLNEFISHERFKPFNEVSITLAEKLLDIVFYQKEKRGYDPRRFYLSVPCRQLDWQLSFTSFTIQIFNQLPTRLFSAKLLTICYIYSMRTGREDVDPAQWLELFQSLQSLSKLRVKIEELVPDVVYAIANEDMAAGISPGLTLRHLKGYQKSPSAIDAAKRFVASCKLANRNIMLRG